MYKSSIALARVTRRPYVIVTFLCFGTFENAFILNLDLKFQLKLNLFRLLSFPLIVQRPPIESHF